MYKIGKKYTLYSNPSLNPTNSIKFESISETFDYESGNYTGSITVNSTSDLPAGEVIDSRFQITTHYEELREMKELKETNQETNTLIPSTIKDEIFKFKSSLEYNFYVKNYEDFLNLNSGIEEYKLPNFYNVLIDSQNNQNNPFEKIFYSPSIDIINAYSSTSKLSVLASKVQNISTDIYFNSINPYKEQFPFYTDISFNTHELSETSIARILQRNNVFDTLMTKISNTYTNPASESSLYYDPKIENEETVLISEFNVSEFFKEFFAEISSTSDWTYIFQINKIIHDKSRSLGDTLNGKNEYSEIIGYHLKKYEGVSSTILQEWFIPNLKNDTWNIVDTQIKYNKQYSYSLDPIVLSISSKYTFTNIDSSTASFKNEPIIKVFILKKNNLGVTYTNKLLDYPPIEPEIQFIPYVGVDNKIKINLNTSIGSKTVPYIVQSTEERNAVAELLVAQNKDSNSTLLTFQSDEPSRQFEIYRSELKPKAYSDFFNKLLTVVETNNSSCGSYEDTFIPNRKYYYTARAIDVHNHFSNPTVVYEVEILNENGLIIPIINIVTFEEKNDNIEPLKSFKRFLKLKPAVIHRIVNEETTNEKDINLGLNDPKPWDKRFKLRITSKSSGKKIDVNFTFKYNKPR